MDNFISGKMTKEGEVTIPIEIREKLGLQEGDRLNFKLDDVGNIVAITASKRKSVLDLFGVVKSDVNAKYDMEQAREEMHNEIANKIMSELDENYDKEKG